MSRLYITILGLTLYNSINVMMAMKDNNSKAIDPWKIIIIKKTAKSKQEYIDHFIAQFNQLPKNKKKETLAKGLYIDPTNGYLHKGFAQLTYEELQQLWVRLDLSEIPTLDQK
ncbi:MAG: hypothetical protein WDZ41_02870 [Candidatus Babeliales bacterium]